MDVDAPALPEVEAEYEQLHDEIAALQERLYAEERQSLPIVLQGIDAAGRDGTIKHVLRGTNPAGVHVTAYRNYVVARVLAGTLSAMNPRFPEPPEDVRSFAERELESAG